MDRRDAEILVQRWARDAVAGGDLDVFDALLHDDVRDLSGGGDARGRESFKARARAVRDAFSHRIVTVDSLIVEGDRIAWRWTLRGTHTGRLLDIDATGRVVTFSGANFQEVRDQRIAQHWTLADTAGLIRQLRESATET